MNESSTGAAVLVSGGLEAADMVQPDHEDAPHRREIQGLAERLKGEATDPSDRVKTSGPYPFPPALERIARHGRSKKGVDERRHRGPL